MQISFRITHEASFRDNAERKCKTADGSGLQTVGITENNMTAKQLLCGHIIYKKSGGAADAAPPVLLFKSPFSRSRSHCSSRYS